MYMAGTSSSISSSSRYRPYASSCVALCPGFAVPKIPPRAPIQSVDPNASISLRNDARLSSSLHRITAGTTVSTTAMPPPCSPCCSTRQTACGQSLWTDPQPGPSSPPWALSAPPPRASSAPLRLRSESRSCRRSRSRDRRRCCCCRRRPKRGPGPIATCRCSEPSESRSECGLDHLCDDCCCCCCGGGGGDGDGGGDDSESEAELRRTKRHRGLDPRPVPPPPPHPPPRLSKQTGWIPIGSSSAKKRGPAPCAETELSWRRGERGRTC